MVVIYTKLMVTFKKKFFFFFAFTSKMVDEYD